jgi:hypothetical protein
LTENIHKGSIEAVTSLYLAELHMVKREFVKRFEKRAKSASLSSREKHDLVKDARMYIKNLSNILPIYQIRKPAIVDIVPAIKQYLIKDYLESNEQVIDCGMEIRVAGYEGICEDALKPMFCEILSNAERACSRIKDKRKWRYEIEIDVGKDQYSDYLILSVSNTFDSNHENSTADQNSTGIGLRNIQHFATFFQRGDVQGWAKVPTENEKKDGIFNIQIYFPRWIKSIKRDS